MLNAIVEWRSTLFDSKKSHNKQTNSPKIKTSKPAHMLIVYNLNSYVRTRHQNHFGSPKNPLRNYIHLRIDLATCCIFYEHTSLSNF